jgi:hypothetical protein
MFTIGRVEDIRPAGNTVARFVRGLDEGHIIATHTLIMQFTYHRSLDRSYHQSIPRAFFNALNGQKFKQNINNNPDDVVSITWKSFNKGQSQVYWTCCRFDEQYVRALTKGVIKKIHDQVCADMHLRSGNFQITSMPQKNIGYQLDLENGAEEVLMRVPATPQPDMIEQEGFIADDNPRDVAFVDRAEVVA